MLSDCTYRASRPLPPGSHGRRPGDSTARRRDAYDLDEGIRRQSWFVPPAPVPFRPRLFGGGGASVPQCRRGGAGV